MEARAHRFGAHRRAWIREAGAPAPLIIHLILTLMIDLSPIDVMAVSVCRV